VGAREAVDSEIEKYTSCLAGTPASRVTSIAFAPRLPSLPNTAAATIVRPATSPQNRFRPLSAPFGRERGECMPSRTPSVIPAMPGKARQECTGRRASGLSTAGLSTALRSSRLIHMSDIAKTRAASVVTILRDSPLAARADPLSCGVAKTKAPSITTSSIAAPAVSTIVVAASAARPGRFPILRHQKRFQAGLAFGRDRGS
jgi:hypothetical protein